MNVLILLDDLFRRLLESDLEQVTTSPRQESNLRPSA